MAVEIHTDIPALEHDVLTKLMLEGIAQDTSIVLRQFVEKFFYCAGQDLGFAIVIRHK